jgi:hypothetical protein
MKAKHTCTYSEFGHLVEINCVACQQDKIFKAGRLSMAREIVEWIEQVKKDWDAQLFFENEWQAKVKEWLGGEK